MSNNSKILLVDDDEGLLRLLKMRLCSAGFIVDTANDGVACLQKLDIFEPDVLISDLRMDKIDGMTLFEEVNQRRPFLPVVLISAHGTIPEAVEATQRGVFSFLPKPIEKDTLFKVIEKALTQSGREMTQKSQSWCADIITQSQHMMEILKKAKLVAQSDSNVLISGESGTGKELLARSLHGGGRRKFGPFIPLNCAATPDELIEVELFGQERGSLSGKDQKGLFLAAKGGTLYLEEIGDLPLDIQGKLLKVLEEGSVRSLGSTTGQGVDVRIIASTTKDLSSKVEDGSFRQDLLTRIGVINIPVPSLNERRGYLDSGQTLFAEGC